MTSFSNRYTHIQKIAEGSFGDVYRAQDTQPPRPVAIKVLKNQYANDAQALHRFRAEAERTVTVNHPNVVTIHETGETETGMPYIVMEWMEGETLAAYQARCSNGKLTYNDMLRMVKQVGAGLTAAHAKGVLHRDIKPANILLSHGDQVAKLSDFGLAAALDGGSISQGSYQSIVGSAGYLAPEITEGGAYTVRSDVYSLGAVVYRLLTGQRAGYSAPPPHTVNRSVPRAASRVISKALSGDPAQRYASVDEFVGALERARLVGLLTPVLVGAGLPALALALWGMGTWLWGAGGPLPPEPVAAEAVAPTPTNAAPPVAMAVVPTATPTETALPMPTPDATATALALEADIAATIAARDATATSVAETATANAPTPTPPPTATATETPTPCPADAVLLQGQCATVTPTSTPSDTPTPTATSTPTPCPANTVLRGGRCATVTPTSTPSDTPSPTATSTPTPCPANTVLRGGRCATVTPTSTPSDTSTPTATSTPTPCPANTVLRGGRCATVTPTPTPSDTPTPTATSTPTPCPANTVLRGARCATVTPTSTPTDTPSPTATRKPTATATSTSGPTSTATSRPTSPSTALSTDAPTILSPQDGSTFDENAVVLLEWMPIKPQLAEDELYVITIQFEHTDQTWTDKAWTRNTSWHLNEHKYLLDVATGSRFEWSVQLIRKTGEDESGVPIGDALSSSSVARVVYWERTTSGSSSGSGGDSVPDKGGGTDNGYP